MRIKINICVGGAFAACQYARAIHPSHRRTNPGSRSHLPGAGFRHTAPSPNRGGKAALLDLVLNNQKKSEMAMNLYERVERVEVRKNEHDPLSAEIKVSRVIPAGTGVDHIPIGPDGKPADPALYHREMLKLERALSWAADDGHAQHDAYEKIAKKQKERNELIDATRTAFLYTFVSTETRGGRVLFKYSLE